MKNILISQRVIIDKYNKIIFSLDDNWEKFFYKKQVKLRTVSLKGLNKKYIDLLKPKALILHGGNDLPVKKKEKSNLIRKKVDEFLLKYAIKKKLPILAVCYGFQLIANFYGEKIIKKSKHVRTEHTIKLDRYFRKKYYKKIRINSYHHYVVKNLPKKFIFLSRCFDGSIELALSKKNKILCTMFHPERKNKDQKLIKKLIFDHLEIK